MWRIVLLAAVVVGVVMLASTAAVAQTEGTLWVEAGEGALGETAYVNVLAEGIPEPGVAAYAVRLEFDPAILEMTTC